MLRIYGASKLHHAPLWLDLRSRDDWPFEWTARWPVPHVGKIPDEAEFAQLFWQCDEIDVRRADVVMVYAEPGDNLRGALVEAGMGIAFGKAVLVVGENPNYGTWQYHPSVHQARNLDAARLILCLLAEIKESKTIAGTVFWQSTD